MVIIEMGQEIGGAAGGSLGVAMVNPKGTKAATDSTNVTTDNVIGVSMEDLWKKDQEEVKHELQHGLEEEMAEQRRRSWRAFRKPKVAS
jgi:hypothetical protein